jgi:hypothetical protein
MVSRVRVRLVNGLLRVTDERMGTDCGECRGAETANPSLQLKTNPPTKFIFRGRVILLELVFSNARSPRLSNQGHIRSLQRPIGVCEFLV